MQHPAWRSDGLEIDRAEEMRKAASKTNCLTGQTGQTYGESVKRHLDIFDLETSLNEVSGFLISFALLPSSYLDPRLPKGAAELWISRGTMETAHTKLKGPDRHLGLYHPCKNVMNSSDSRLESSMLSIGFGRVSSHVNSKLLQNSAAKTKPTRDQVNMATMEVSTKRSSTVVVVLPEQTRRRDEEYVITPDFRLLQ